MKKVMAILMGVLLAGSFTVAKAEVLSDTQLAGISAGDFDTDINDDVTAENSAVSSQKNIGTVGSTDGAVSGSSITNTNTASVSNLGDSAVALQANIGVIAGLGTQAVSTGNSISNENEAEVGNLITANPGSTDASFEGLADSGDTAGLSSMFSTVNASQSAVASQNNIGAIFGAGGVSAGVVSNTNTADITNSSL